MASAKPVPFTKYSSLFKVAGLVSGLRVKLKSTVRLSISKSPSSSVSVKVAKLAESTSVTPESVIVLRLVKLKLVVIGLKIGEPVKTAFTVNKQAKLTFWLQVAVKSVKRSEVSGMPLMLRVSKSK